MATDLATNAAPNGNGEVLEEVLVGGNLARLTPHQRAAYYLRVCSSLGLNPLTRPFEYVAFQGKTILYARKDATDQLRNLRKVSLTITARETVGDLYVVTARAALPDGRTDEEIGAVPIAGLRGEALANAMMKASCVPLDSEILTRDGFKRYDEVAVGDAVLAYDVEDDCTRWTPLQAINVFESGDLVRLHSAGGQFDVRCTSDHSWAVRRTQPYQPDARGDGSRGPRGPYRSRGADRALVEAQALKSSHGIVLAAVCHDGTLPLSPVEAAVLGWAVTDGTIKRVGNSVRIGICQSKEHNFAPIREMVEAVAPGAKEFVSPARQRTFPAGYTSETLPQHWWYIPAAVTRAILERSGFHDRADLPGIAARLAPAARRAMLQAFMLAEGTERGSFINGDQHVLDAFQILCALEGLATGRQASRGTVWTQRLKKTRHVAVSMLRSESAGQESVWCPTTPYGTWVMRQNGRVMITGNTKAKRRATLSLCGLGVLDETEVDAVPGARRVDDDGVIHDESDLEPSPRHAAIKAAMDVDDVDVAEPTSLRGDVEDEQRADLAERRRQAAAMNPPNERARTEAPAGVPGDDVEALSGEDLTEACLRMRRALNAANVPAPAVPKGEANLRVWWRHCAGLLSARA